MTSYRHLGSALVLLCIAACSPRSLWRSQLHEAGNVAVCGTCWYQGAVSAVCDPSARTRWIAGQLDQPQACAWIFYEDVRFPDEDASLRALSGRLAVVSGKYSVGAVGMDSAYKGQIDRPIAREVGSCPE